MIVAYLLYVFSWIWEEMYQQQLYNGEKQQGKPYLLIFNPTYWLRYIFYDFTNSFTKNIHWIKKNILLSFTFISELAVLPDITLTGMDRRFAMNWDNLWKKYLTTQKKIVCSQPVFSLSLSHHDCNLRAVWVMAE